MKKLLSITELLGAYSYRTTKEGEKGVAPIDVLNIIPFKALAANRASTIRRKIKPIIDTYFEISNKKQKEKQKLCADITEKHNKSIKDEHADSEKLNTQLQKDLFDAESKINKEISELQNEKYEIDFHPIKLSDFKIDPDGDNEDSSNWHEFKGEHFDFLDWLIVDDIDVSDDKEISDDEIAGLDETVKEAVKK